MYRRNYYPDSYENRKRQRDYGNKMIQNKLDNKVHNMNIQKMQYDKVNNILYASKLEYMNLPDVKKIMVHNNQTSTSKLFNFEEYSDSYYVYKSEDGISLYVK